MRKLVSTVTLLAFAAQMTACNVPVKQSHINWEMENLIRALETEQQYDAVPGATIRVQRVHQVQGAAIESAVAVNYPPELTGKLSATPAEAKAFIADNEQKIWKWLDGIDEANKKSRQLVYDISKEAFESTNEQIISRDYVLLYFSLEYQRNLYKSMVGLSTPMMMAAGSEELKNVPEVSQFREKLVKRFFTYLGAQMVVQNDIKKVAQTLKLFKDKNVLTPELLGIVANLHKAVAARNGQDAQGIQGAVSKMPEDQRAKLKDKLEEFTKGYEGVSFLYSPNNKLGPLANTLIVIGNLTWGLCNTLIGLGVVITTMIVSPFTRYVDFPTFALAKNGHMIYVDVSGMSPIAGKMSLGLWELDNHAGYYFASGHEGVHAIQSAVLGPLYLPLVLASYVVSGFDRGYFENQADEWAWID